ncbi:MAG: radical SAM protein [Clostridia bacterium]|nr:radical SAM protein [Clostridia bacterium]
MSRHVNIPIFVPHLGCPNQCVFCNQRTISGKEIFSMDTVRGEIEAVLSTVSDAECEIAFFGGSFTGIERPRMLALLELANEYVKRGQVTGIRMSTRPDYIDPDIITILKQYPISCVELGVQSMDDAVLSRLKRGHTIKQTEQAFSQLAAAGIPSAGQMMIGLPGATAESECETAEAICRMGASAARIYPTVVFRDTELAEWLADGIYCPLTVEEAVCRAKNVLSIFLSHRVPCLRIGLCDSENLHSDTTYLAGPNHSAMGELVMSAVYRDRILSAIDRPAPGRHLRITCPRGHTSKVLGHRGATKRELMATYGFSTVKVEESPLLTEYTVKIDVT